MASNRIEKYTCAGALFGFGVGLFSKPFMEYSGNNVVVGGIIRGDVKSFSEAVRNTVALLPYATAAAGASIGFMLAIAHNGLEYFNLIEKNQGAAYRR